jgi:hypothetical protein
MVLQIKSIRNNQMQDTVSPTLAIDSTPLLSNIVLYCLSQGQAADLALDDQFMNARYREHQIVRLFEFASTQLHIEPSVRPVARAFEVNHTVLVRAELRSYDDPPARGRHREPSADCEPELIVWLANRAENQKAVNRTELLHECTEPFGKGITRGWIDSFITGHAHQLFETKSIPQENTRLEVPRVFLEAAIDGFRDHVHNGCAELVFDLDEIGGSE